jgi:hypothetical protein
VHGIALLLRVQANTKERARECGGEEKMYVGAG